MVKVGEYNTLTVIKEVEFGMYLDGGKDEILLPKRFVPKDLKVDDEIKVFIYHDNEQRLIATSQEPLGSVGEIVYMEVADTTPAGAFVKWGIMKDIFVPISQQESRMRPGSLHFIKIYIDEQTGRVTGTEKIDKHLSNYELTIKEGDTVNLLVYKKTDIGYKVIINNLHLGLLHFNEIFRELEMGEKLSGYIKHIRPDNKIDVSAGIKGYAKVADEESRILDLLAGNSGYLPFNDKSSPEEIYDNFGMSKKVFKMTLGALYKKKKIEFTEGGIKSIEE